ncbi:MAG: DUF3313 domain-containing protein [Verrucomicrobia bacterium]|nr:DUF3313 domain-containing protein [Verrucomicrobiota bacterium]
MKTKLLNVVLLVTAGLLMAACSSAPKSAKYSDVPDADKLQPNPQFPHGLVYIKEGVKFAQYSKFIIGPVEIYQGSGASWHKGKVTGQMKQELAQFAQTEFARVLGPKYPIVNQPGPDVLYLRLMLTDVELTTPTMAVVTHFSPIGMGVNLMKSGAGAQGSFIGSVTMAGELRDSSSDTVLAAFLTKQTPLAVDLSKTVGNLSAARDGITATAERFKAAMDRRPGVAAPGP